MLVTTGVARRSYRAAHETILTAVAWAEARRCRRCPVSRQVCEPRGGAYALFLGQCHAEELVPGLAAIDRALSDFAPASLLVEPHGESDLVAGRGDSPDHLAVLDLELR